jgi:hypothetical protein
MAKATIRQRRYVGVTEWKLFFKQGGKLKSVLFLVLLTVLI